MPPTRRWVLRCLGLALLGLGRRAEARAALASSLEILATGHPTPNLELSANPPRDRSRDRAQPRCEPLPAWRVPSPPFGRTRELTEPPSELELRRRFEQPLIDALGEEEWARERAAGATLTLEEAIELARTLATAAAPSIDERDLG